MSSVDSLMVFLTNGVADDDNPESASLDKHLENADTKKRYETLGPVERGMLSLSYYSPRVSHDVVTFKLENFLDGDKFTPAARFQLAVGTWFATGTSLAGCSSVTYVGFQGISEVVADLSAACASWGTIPWFAGAGAKVIELDYDACDWVLLNMEKTTLRKVAKDAQEVRQSMELVKSGQCGSRTKMSCLLSLAHWRGML